MKLGKWLTYIANKMCNICLVIVWNLTHLIVHKQLWKLDNLMFGHSCIPIFIRSLVCAIRVWDVHGVHKY